LAKGGADLRRAKKWLPVVLFLLLGLSQGPRATQLSATPLDRLQVVKNRGVLIVGVRYDAPGYGWMNPKTGKVEGFEIDLAHYIAEKIVGSPDKVEFTEVGTESRISMLQQGDVDVVLSTMVATPERRKAIDLSNYYFPNALTFMVTDNSTFSGDVKDIRGKTDCVLVGGTAQQLLLSVATPKYGITANDTKVIFLPGTAECIEALKSGRADFMFNSQLVEAALAKQTPGLRILSQFVMYSPWAVGVAKGNPELLAAVNAAITAAYNDGTWATLYRKWSQEDPPTGWRPGS